MSKRKADEAFGGDADANESPSWAEDLPDEVTRKIETTLACPKSVTAMEATCKSWRQILQKTDIDYWEPKALKRFPRLSLMCKARESKMAGSGSRSSGVSRGTALSSWKKLYWKQLQAEHRPKLFSTQFKPVTSIDDYAFTVEFHLEGKMLFEETFTAQFSLGEIVGPNLWSYQFPEDQEDDNVNVSLDPRLTSRLGSFGSKDPFSDEADDDWEKVTVDVIVHRLSDLTSVKLLEHTAFVTVAWMLNLIRWGNKHLSCRGYFVLEGETLDVGYSKDLPAMEKPMLDVSLHAETGRVLLRFGIEAAVGADSMTEQELLRYLEVQCPWPTTG